MMLNHKTVRAASVEEAIEIGLKQLDIPRDQAEIRVINEGKKGFLGFGKQEAIVEIHKLNDMSLSQLTQELERRDNNKEIINDSSFHSETAIKSADETIEENDYHENETIEKDEQSKDNSPSMFTATETINDEEKTSSNAKEKLTEKKLKTFQGKNAYESAEIVSNYLIAIIKDYGADASIEMDIEGKNVFFDIHTDKSGLVIGKHGKIINSLQILAQTYLSAIHQKHLNVILNVGDYRKRRAKVLQSIAEQKAEEAKKTGKPAVVEPLPAYERKQIHKYLSHLKSFKTYSQGREPKRQLVIEYVLEDDENSY